jgi:prevent-host-death family protein
MTIIGHLQVTRRRGEVSTRAGIAELKSKLSEYLRVVRRGGTVTVFDRDTPVARLVPIESPTPRLQIRPPVQAGRIQDVPLPPPLALPFDIVEILKEERGSR